MSSFDQSYDAAVAVIGMALRFPGADSPQAFWRNLRAGTESVVELSDDELLAAGVPSEALSDPRYVKRAAPLSGAEQFDAAFFGMSPREAALTDPQQRLLLECAWEAVEAAGYDSVRAGGRVGVFAGAGLNRYLVENLLPDKEQHEEPGGMQVMLGNERDFVATRMAYKLDLRGPAVSVATACSTSLVAVHMACQSLLSGECEAALAGGVSVRVPTRVGYWYQAGGPLSPDGHCRAFDKRGSGTLFGSGVGVVMLKRFADALRDGDRIRAVIRGTAVNNDGSRKVGYTAPSVAGQAAVIAEALEVAGVHASDVTYIEAHGTGTELGDPVEVAALAEVFGREGADVRCALGSVKANFGHLDTAAGVAGLIKAVLQLERGELAPQINFEEFNPRIEFGGASFYVNTEPKEWARAEGGLRRAGVSSFGIGGTNAHVIVEEAPEQTSSAPSARGRELLVLSAKTEGALDKMTAALAAHLRAHPDESLADVAYTLQVGRKQFGRRRVVVGRDARDAAEALEQLDRRRVFDGLYEASGRPVAFMFPGGGSQHVNMGRDLYRDEPVFRQQVDACAEILRTRHGHDLLEYLYPARPEDEEEAARRLKQTPYALPALFVTEYALAKLYESWGVRPAAMIGHSLGEYVAACLAGVFSLEDALALVVHRARLLTRLAPGAMLSVPLPEEEVRALADGKLSLAAVNGPSQCVVSGPTATVDELGALLERRGVEFRRLHIDAPGHSEMVAPILAPFTEFARELRMSAPRVPFVSNVTGTWFGADDAHDPTYWATHLRETVRFGAGLGELTAKDDYVLLEVGPGQTLSSLTKLQLSQERASAVLTSMRHPQEKRDDTEFLLTALGRLWLQGVRVDWKGVHGGERRRRVALPTYPFERQRYWIEPSTRGGVRRAGSLHKRRDVAEWFYVPSWRQTPRPGLAGTRGGVAKSEGWLVFLDRCGVGEELVRGLRRRGHTVYTVEPGARFEAFEGDAFRVRPSEARDYELLLAELKTRDAFPREFVHMWGVTPSAETPSGAEAFERLQETGFYSLLNLAQAVGEQQVAGPLRWSVISNGVQAVTGDEELSPEKATALGLCKVIPQEYADINCRSIDVLLPRGGGDEAATRKLGERLASELTAQTDEEAAVAYRGEHRWAQSFEPVRIGAPDAGALRVREGGVYLITGGLGEVGLVVAEYLAREFRARLALTSRTPLPAREEWSRWLETHDGEDRVARLIAKIRRLEEHGAEVLTLRADVADVGEMRGALASVRERFGALHGVVHAAGSKVSATVQEIGREECERQFRTKVRGLYVLEEVLRGGELDFCLVVSSLSSVLGVMGMAAYSSAHVFMDAFVERHNRTEAQPWTAVNWDNWRAALAAGKTTEEAGLFMSPAEAEQALARVLAVEDPTARLLVSTADLAARVEKWVGRKKSSPAEGAAEVEEAATLHERPALRSSYVAPRDEVEAALAAIWQQTLGIAEVGVEDNYFDLGGDSVLAIHIVARAKQSGIRLTPKQLFLHQTVAELAAAAETVTSTVAARPEEVSGLVPLTPIQHWFFEQEVADPHHWNLALMLDARGPLNHAALTGALAALTAHHDALRLRYERGCEGWTQTHAARDAEAATLHVVDLRALGEEARRAVVERVSAALQRGLNLSEGPLARVAHFVLGDGREGGADKLLWVIHHLAVDAVSLRVLLEDFETAYGQLARGEAVGLPPKTSSFQQWSRALGEYAAGEALTRETDCWLSLPWDEVTPLAADHERGPNTIASSRTLPTTFGADETKALLQTLPQTLNVQINEVLLAALGQALGGRGGAATLVDLEGHGREELFEAIDLSRTVGWFTTIYPFVLRGAGAGDLAARAAEVRDELRAVPARGIGYGLLRHLAPDSDAARRVRSLPRAELSFLYLGQFDNLLPGASPFALAAEMPGATRSPAGLRPYLVEVTSIVTGGRLRVNWTYSENFHRRETIEELARRFGDALRGLTAAGGRQPVAPTPADFPAANLSQKELDKIMSRLKA